MAPELKARYLLQMSPVFIPPGDIVKDVFKGLNSKPFQQLCPGRAYALDILDRGVFCYCGGIAGGAASTGVPTLAVHLQRLGLLHSSQFHPEALRAAFQFHLFSSCYTLSR